MNMTSADLSQAAWYKSSYSANNSNCVEVARLDLAVAVRDSKDPDGPALVFPRSAAMAFFGQMRAGLFRSA